jgi:hypothetical protein
MNILTDELKDITIDCPVCEESVTIKARDIRLAIQHKKETDGKILIWCPECCRVLELPEATPQDGVALDEWLGNMAENPDDWCGCVPVLDDTVVRIPNGGYADLNVWYWRPGGGGKALRKRRYMLEYGIQPECHNKKNPAMGGKPVVTG